MKGARNASDLNRIANNCIVLRNTFIANGYSIKELQQKINWDATATDWTKWPKVSDLQLVLDDVNMLRSLYIVMTTTPQVPLIPINSYQKMNDIERILFDMELLINKMIADMFFSGEIYAGEDDFV